MPQRRSSREAGASPSGTISDRVYEYLSQEIRSGRIGLGARLNIKQLAGELDVSTIPIRDAIKRLEQERIVEVRPRSGCLVRIPTRMDTLQALDARRMVEVSAVLNYAATPDPARLADLDRIVADMAGLVGRHTDAVPDGGQYAELDRAFHRGLCSLAGNAHLDRFAGQVSAFLAVGIGDDGAWQRAPAVTFREHVAILSHLRRPGGDAARLLDQHLRKDHAALTRSCRFRSLPG